MYPALWVLWTYSKTSGKPSTYGVIFLLNTPFSTILWIYKWWYTVLQLWHTPTITTSPAPALDLELSFSFKILLFKILGGIVIFLVYLIIRAMKIFRKEIRNDSASWGFYTQLFKIMARSSRRYEFILTAWLNAQKNFYSLTTKPTSSAKGGRLFSIFKLLYDTITCMIYMILYVNWSWECWWEQILHLTKHVEKTKFR